MSRMVALVRRERWSPWVVGAGIGVLSWITFGLMGKALGVSTTLVRWAGMLESLFALDHVRQNAYFAKYLVDKPAIDWQMMLVIGLLLGAVTAALTGGGYRHETIPTAWRRRFGAGRGRRYLAAFAGGAIMLFGARLAGGCTSGHGISGSLQLSVSSWLFFISFFAAGVVAAMLMFARTGDCHDSL